MAQRRTHGFWKGVLSGLVLAAAGFFALAWLYPPAPVETPPAAATPAPSIEAQPGTAATPPTPAPQQ